MYITGYLRCRHRCQTGRAFTIIISHFTTSTIWHLLSARASAQQTVPASVCLCIWAKVFGFRVKQFYGGNFVRFTLDASALFAGPLPSDSSTTKMLFGALSLWIEELDNLMETAAAVEHIKSTWKRCRNRTKVLHNGQYLFNLILKLKLEKIKTLIFKLIQLPSAVAELCLISQLEERLRYCGSLAFLPLKQLRTLG